MPSLDDLLSVVDTWFAEEVQRPPVSYHTDIYNQMFEAKNSLRNRLSVAITGEPLSSPPPSEPEGGEAGISGPDTPGADENAGEEASGASDEAQSSAGAGKTSKSSKAGA